MVELTLPKNSKLTVGKTWPNPEGSKKIKLFNANLESRLLNYKIYPGTKKDKK